MNGTACGCHELFPFLSACLAELRDDAFFAELPAALRTDIAHELAQPLLEQSDVFNCMTKSAQRVLAARLTPLAVPAGHNVAQEGDPATTLWLLQEGASAVRLAHRRPVLSGTSVWLPQDACPAVCITCPLLLSLLRHLYGSSP